MKPFNLKQAKAGKPVCTRDGKDVRNLTSVTACAFTYKTKEDALSHKPSSEGFVLAKIEWEEE